MLLSNTHVHRAQSSAGRVLQTEQGTVYAIKYGNDYGGHVNAGLRDIGRVARLYCPAAAMALLRIT
eukprot:4699728-Amphidinium_carterae.1